MKSSFIVLTAVLLFMSIPFFLGDRSQGSVAAATRPLPTPEKPLTKARVDALLEKLLGSLAQTLEDDESVDLVRDRWTGRRDLVGKTRRQVIELLFDDLRSLLDDQETLKIVWSNWTGEKDLPKAMTEPSKSPTEPKKTLPSPTP